MTRVPTAALFAVCVIVWSTTWYAITWQVDTAAPEVGVAARFGLAGAVVLAALALRGLPWRRGPREHARFALQGVLLYGISYVAVYHAETLLVSGLVAVGYSASPLLGGLGSRWLFGTPLTRRFVAGGLLGLAGVALIFWPEFGHAAAAAGTAAGVAWTTAAVLLSAGGALAASRNRSHGLPLWPTLGWGMVYGALAALLCAALLGRSFALPAAPSWWLALGYLAIVGSVLTFACYLTIVDRLGAGASGTIGVMTPLLALVVSLLLEGYRPQWISLAGALLAAWGNVWMLRPAAPLRAAAAAAE
ncbi:DMT family transporter [Piscinibacter defluvii]|uniref:DMT family transporter n=1 Tax=Piscinibacter defluvii TaxID=1796922 RepID=UPI000FDF5B00|nr:EamA family transporter [Piscinibacter defluvii]